MKKSSGITKPKKSSSQTVSLIIVDLLFAWHFRGISPEAIDESTICWTIAWILLLLKTCLPAYMCAVTKWISAFSIDERNYVWSVWFVWLRRMNRIIIIIIAHIGRREYCLSSSKSKMPKRLWSCTFLWFELKFERCGKDHSLRDAHDRHWSCNIRHSIRYICVVSKRPLGPRNPATFFLLIQKCCEASFLLLLLTHTSSVQDTHTHTLTKTIQRCIAYACVCKQC